MTAALAAPTRPPLAADEYVTFGAGRVVITLQCIRVDQAYSITCHQGSHRLEDNCTSVADENTARAIARGYAHLFLAEAAA